MAIRRVKQTEFDGSSVTTTFGRHEIQATSASYGDSLETEVIKNMGSQRQDGRTPGTYKTDTASIKFKSSIFRARLMPLFPKNGGGNVIVPIVVGFTNPEIGSDSDFLAGCRCTNFAAAMEASNKALEIETKWELLQIFWTSERKTINYLDPIQRVALLQSKF